MAVDLRYPREGLLQEHQRLHRDIGVENDVTMLVEFANGATGTFTTCTHDAIGTDRLEIDLDGGKIVVDNSKTAHVYHYIDKEGNPCTEDYLNEHMSMMEVAMLTSGNGAGAKLYTEETFENNDGWGFQHTTVMQNFAAHILTGSPLLAPGGGRHQRCQPGKQQPAVCMDRPRGLQPLRSRGVCC